MYKIDLSTLLNILIGVAITVLGTHALTQRRARQEKLDKLAEAIRSTLSAELKELTPMSARVQEADLQALINALPFYRRAACRKAVAEYVLAHSGCGRDSYGGSHYNDPAVVAQKIDQMLAFVPPS